MMARKVTLVPYNPGWPAIYEIEAVRLARLLRGEVLTIHHMGSTAIPYINAKPIIDVLVEVQDISRIDLFNNKMTKHGYIPMGEYGIRGRRFFIKGDYINRTHHIHMFQKGNPEIGRHLRFRDYLISHPKEAQAYSRLKDKLARRFPKDIESYTQGKDNFITKIDEKARQETA
jgi:GrpB-like predicted nucleotidyltransferase (UPF0157 family)